jgi:hypothetical protein
MTVYVDNARISYGRMKMCHMVADTVDELHAFAESLGIRRHFQNTRIPHYDVCLSTRARAIKMGAKEVSSREIIKMSFQTRSQDYVHSESFVIR